MRNAGTAGAILGMGLLLFEPRASLGQAPGRIPVVTTPHFAIFSGCDTGLQGVPLGRPGRDEPSLHRRAEAASAADWRLPGDLWHVVLFCTTGEAVRRVLSDGGKPGYTPMVYAIFDRSAWGGYREALESARRPYIDGERALSDAAAGLIAALRSPAEPQPGRPSGR